MLDKNKKINNIQISKMLDKTFILNIFIKLSGEKIAIIMIKLKNDK